MVREGLLATPFLFVQFPLPPERADLGLFPLAETLLVPPVTDPQPDRKDYLYETALLEERRDDLGPPAFFHKRARG